MENKKLQNLLPNLACMACGKNFTEESINVVRHEDGLLVLKIKCTSCDKCFGMALLGLEVQELLDALGDTDGELKPISYDDVIDAHKYLKDIDENWSKFIAGRKA